MTTLTYLLSAIPLKHCVLIAIILLFACPLYGKRKDDIVTMKNGDKFTGEIKALQYGELIFKSDYMKDSVHLDWKSVDNLQSKDTFIVSLTDGTLVTGSIAKNTTSSEGGKDFRIVGEGNAVEVTVSDVIAIGQREASFWNQLTGSISYGFGFASGNKQPIRPWAQTSHSAPQEILCNLPQLHSLVHRSMPRTPTGSHSIRSTLDYLPKNGSR